MSRLTKLQKVERLIRHVEKDLNDRGFYPRSNVPLDLVLLALLSKSIVTSKAVCALVRSGYHEEAFGLTRTLADTYFTTHYISNKDSLDRAEKFAFFFARNYADWLGIAEKYYPHRRPELPPQHEEMVRMAATYRNPHRWTGLGDQTKAMASEPSTHELKPDGRPVDASFDYEVIYKWTSHYVHPTVVALDAHAVEGGSRFFVHAGKRRSSRFRDLALFNVVSLLAKIFVCGARGLRSQLSPTISDEWNHLLRTW